MPDRLTVDDDALISTDVDKLIRTISARKKVELGELEKETGIGRKNVEKWVHVLEEEGYIHVDYKLTKTYVTWAGETVTEGEDEPEVREAVEDSREKQVDSPFQEFRTKPEVTLSKDDFLEHRAKKQVLEDLVDEGELEEEKPHKKEQKEEPKKAEQKEEPKTKSQKEEPKRELQEEKLPEHLQQDVEVSFSEIEVMQKEEVPEREETPVYAEKKSRRTLTEKREIPLKEKVNAYLAEINLHRSEVSSLKKEKENIYRDRYMKLESKVEADIVSITERILEKEGRLIELKERLFELPDRVNEADKLQRAAERIGKESRASLDSIKKKVSSLINDAESMEAEVTEKVEDIQSELGKSHKKMVELEENVIAIGSEESRIRQMLSDLEKQAADLDGKMKSALSALEESTELKIEITEMTDQLRVSVERREKQLTELNQELGEIKKVENWVKEYVDDYERKIDEIEEYVTKSDDEMDKLREAAEREYINKYLKELENVTKIYEGELEGISAEEKSVDDRIVNAKQRLSGLIEESQQMIRKLYKEGEGSIDYGSVLRERKANTVKVKVMVEEKEKEKERLSEDMEKAKKVKKRKK